MNQTALVLLGLLFTLASSWWGLVLVPQLQLGRQEPVAVPGTTQTYPSPRPGWAALGQEVYRANGCFYCHTRQVQATGLAPEFQTTHAIVRYLGADLERGWGQRASVAQDYLRDQPVMIGQLRVGPDLANLGTRRPHDELGANLMWHLRHLYDPPSVVEHSAMPAHRFLFEKRPLKPGQATHRSLFGNRELKSGPPTPTRAYAWVDQDPRFEVVPSPEALALAACLFSLQADRALYEAPLPSPSKPTRAPAKAPVIPATNSPTP